MTISYTIETSGTKRSIYTFNVSPDRKALDLCEFIYYTRASMIHPEWQEKRRFDSEDVKSSNIKKQDIKVPRRVLTYLLEKLNGKSN